MNTILYIAVLLSSFSSNAQQPVQWDFSYNQTNETVELTATIEDGWHIYSQHLKENAGPIPTSFEFNKNPLIKLKGKTKEPVAVEKYDVNFESDLSYFEHNVSFTQKIRPKEATSISGTVTYMVCNETMCLPPVDVPFEVKLK